jgi:TPR repeat protein
MSIAMRRRLGRVLTLAIVLAGMAAVRFGQAGVAEGVAAYERGDFAAALRELAPAAEAGDAAVQSLLGYMHDFGLGVPEDDREAARWYLRAARAGEPIAQLNLGLMHADGLGVEQSLVQALVWLSRAVEGLQPGEDRDEAIRNRDLARSLMTPEQIREAERLLAGPA